MRLVAVAFVIAGVGLKAGGPGSLPPVVLEDACRQGDVAKVEHLLTSGADPNGAGAGAPTSPLTAALLALPAEDPRASQIVRLLIDNEADVNQPADLRPLYASILRGHTRATQALLAAGANPDLAGAMRATLPNTRMGETPRQLAVKLGEPWLSMVGGAVATDAPVHVAKKTELKRATLCSEP
jgi:hypothetical protein